MSLEISEWQRIQQTLNTMVNLTSIETLIMVHKAKISINEMLKCQTISELKKIPIEHVFKKMAHFKESSAYLIYKQEFTY